MPFASALSSAYRVFEMLVLSFTSHARLSLAAEPADYDVILKRTVREVKFYSETLLAILLFSVTESPYLTSQALGCLMFCLMTYIILEAMTGDTLHEWIDNIPCGRIVLACMTKLPAISVLWTLSALALCQWDSLATKIVLCIVAGVLLLGFTARLGLHRLVGQGCVLLVQKTKEGVAWLSMVTETTMSLKVQRKRKLSDATTESGGSDSDASSMESGEKEANLPSSPEEYV